MLYRKPGKSTARFARVFCTWLLTLTAVGIVAHAQVAPLSDSLFLSNGICGTFSSGFLAEDANETSTSPIVLTDPGCTIGDLSISPFMVSLFSDPFVPNEFDPEEAFTTTATVMPISDATEAPIFSDSLTLSGWNPSPNNSTLFGCLSEAGTSLTLSGVACVAEGANGGSISLTLPGTTIPIFEPNTPAPVVSDTLTISPITVTLNSDGDPGDPFTEPPLNPGAITVSTVPEPSAAIPIGLGLGALLTLRRRAI
jgi:hypothetical protein